MPQTLGCLAMAAPGLRAGGDDDALYACCELVVQQHLMYAYVP